MPPKRPAWRHTTRTATPIHSPAAACSHGDGRRTLRLPATFSAGARRSAARGRISSSRNLSRLDSCTAKASASGAEPSASGGGEDASEIIDTMEVKSSSPAASFLAKVALALGVAATATVISLLMKQPSSGPSFSLPQIIDASAPPDAVATIGYTFSLFVKKVIIPEYTPGLGFL